MESDKPTSSSRKITSDDPAPERERTKRKSSKKSPVNRKKKKIDKNFSKRKFNGGDSDEESIDDTRKDYAGRMPEVNVLTFLLRILTAPAAIAFYVITLRID